MPRDAHADTTTARTSVLHGWAAADGWARGGGRAIFSLAWLQHRLLKFLIATVAVAFPTAMAAMSETDDWRAVVIATILIPLPLLTYPAIGPSLAVWVRSRRLARRRETIALAAAIALGAGAAWAFDHGVDRGLRMALYGDADKVIGLQTTAGVFIHKRGEDIHSHSAPPSEDDMRKRLRERFGVLVDVANGAIVLTLMLWFGGGFELIAFFRQRREMDEAERQEALARANAARNEAELRLSVLAAQVEPHFLFNTLAGVRSAITSDPQRAVAIVDHLADYLRASIPRMRSDGALLGSTVANQLDIVRAYLGLMHARMPRLTYAIDCDADLHDASMPPLMLISLVENAVRHGIEPKIGPGRIAVRVHRADDDGSLIASVEDDGAGFGGATAGTGIGLVNIRERLAGMYGNAASLSLSARDGGGVAACLRLPLLRAPAASGDGENQ
jgi:hypothetical protein